MAKPARKQEPGGAPRPSSSGSTSRSSASLEGDAYADGGDRFWLDDTTAAIGLGYRTNRAGASALQALLNPEGVHVETYDMPHDQGPDYVLHLQSFLSAATEELFVVYEPLAPVRLLQDISRARHRLDRDRRARATTRWAATSSRCGPASSSWSRARRRCSGRWRHKGVEVHAYDGTDLSLKGDGGPTCLTAPLLRA